MHCPYRNSKDQCEVASRIAKCNVRTSDAACLACQRNTNPRAVNVVTLGLAIVHRKRLGKYTDQLRRLLPSYLPQDDAPDTLKINHYRPGPGTELKRVLVWFAQPNESCNCESHAETMNDWGAQGCRQNIETIVNWLMEEAQQRGMPHGKFTRVVARSLVNTAISRFERKYPDGPPDSVDTTEDELDRATLLFDQS